MIGRPDDLAHENINQEQDEEDTQAQSVTEEARHRNTAEGLDDTEKPSNRLDPAEAPDLVDHMKQMDSDGGVDMSAYDGEESMDDLENRHGVSHAADKQFSEDDS